MLMADSKMASKLADIVRVFQLPDWYIPSMSEITRLSTYVEMESSDCEARWARYLDCAAFCNEEDCFFCGEIQPISVSCCNSKLALPRRD